MRLVEFVAADPLAPTTVRDPAKVLDDHLRRFARGARSHRGAGRRDDCRSRGRCRLSWNPACDRAPGCRSAPSWRAVAGSARLSSGRSRSPALRNARPFHARAESWAEGLRSFELVTARALAHSTSWPSMRPRCCASAARSWPGVAGADPERRQPQPRQPRYLGLEVHQPLPVVPYRARSTVTSISCRRSGRPRSGSRGGRASRASGRSGSEMTASDRVRR